MSEKFEARETLLDAVRALKDLPNDWDGEGGSAATSNAISKAVAVIEALPASAPTPLLSYGGAGEILLEWRGNGRLVHVSAFEDDLDGGAVYGLSTSRPPRVGEAYAQCHWIAQGEPIPVAFIEEIERTCPITT